MSVGLLVAGGIIVIGVILVAIVAVVVFLLAFRPKMAANSAEAAELRKEVVRLYEENARLREELEQLKKGRGVDSSPHIKEG